jgi:hypothetical protein
LALLFIAAANAIITCYRSALYRLYVIAGTIATPGPPCRARLKNTTEKQYIETYMSHATQIFQGRHK